MISFSIVKSFVIEKGLRILKVNQFHVKTADVVSDFGDDSAPLKDMIAIYANTSEVGDNIVIGYINKNQIAEEGEKRIFSLKPDGSISFFMHLKNDGTSEIGGNNDNAVRYQALEDKLQEQITKLNAELEKIRIGLVGVGGVYAKQDVNVDFSSAKINEIKVL